MKCFTITSGTVTAGIAVQKMKLSGAGVEIDAVMVGESGRGRELGVLPVGGHPEAPMVPCDHGQWSTGYTKTCPDCGLPAGPMRQAECAYGSRQTDTPEHRGEKRGGRPLLIAADVGQTRAGKPKLVREASAAKTADFCIVAFRTSIGFRGGNSHTGDRGPGKWKTDRHGGHTYDTIESAEQAARETACDPAGVVEVLDFLPFPGDIICRGAIAQGDAGGMGSGQQIVAVMPRGVVFRTAYSGRLYGAPGAHYYVFDGENILAATWEERAASDCF